MDIVKFEHVESKILEIRGTKVILDSDLAELYGVETKRINEAVKNNPDRFPSDYTTELTTEEKTELVENFDRFKRLKHSSVTPKAFTEKGLYMLATTCPVKCVAPRRGFNRGSQEPASGADDVRDHRNLCQDS